MLSPDSTDILNGGNGNKIQYTRHINIVRCCRGQHLQFTPNATHTKTIHSSLFTIHLLLNPRHPILPKILAQMDDCIFTVEIDNTVGRLDGIGEMFGLFVGTVSNLEGGTSGRAQRDGAVDRLHGTVNVAEKDMLYRVVPGKELPKGLCTAKIPHCIHPLQARMDRVMVHQEVDFAI